MQKAYNKNLNVIANHARFFLKKGYLEKQMKAANPSLKTETIFQFPAIYPCQDLLGVIPSFSRDVAKF